MVKFGPNFCYCAVDQEKAVFKRKRAVSSPSALFGPGRPTKSPWQKGASGRPEGPLRDPANASREASGRPWEGPERAF